MALLILSADPVALTPETILRLSVLPCACGARGAHRIYGARAGGFSAWCGCGEAEIGQQTGQHDAHSLHDPSSLAAGAR